VSLGVFILYTVFAIALGWTLCSLHNYYMVQNLCNEIEEKDEIIRKLRKENNNKDTWRF
jgi:hypothetical protein